MYLLPAVGILHGAVPYGLWSNGSSNSAGAANTLVALALCLLLSTCTPLEKFREISYEGTELTVTLGSNKETGYSWDVEIEGDCIRRSINSYFKTVGLLTGKSHISLEGLSEGSATIVFTTSAGWDGTGKGDTYVVNVDVGADGTILSAEEADTE